MSSINLLLTLACVLAICSGQLLFKQVGMEIQEAGGWCYFRPLLLGSIACLVYGGATVLWINLLRTIELNRIYPFMALSFVIVPLMSWVIYNERVSGGYFIGAACIVLGLVIIATTQ